MAIYISIVNFVYLVLFDVKKNEMSYFFTNETTLNRP